MSDLGISFEKVCSHHIKTIQTCFILLPLKGLQKSYTFYTGTAIFTKLVQHARERYKTYHVPILIFKISSQIFLKLNVVLKKKKLKGMA